jgi:hypothetical protein
MTTQFAVDTPSTDTHFTRGQWAKLGLLTAVVSVVAILLVQAAAIAMWPEIALFGPLDSYLRSAVFTLVPVLGATAVFAWLAARNAAPVATFVKIAVIVLVVSIIPDYILPVPNKTLLASSVTAFLHVVAGTITILMLVTGYRRQTDEA